MSETTTAAAVLLSDLVIGRGGTTIVHDLTATFERGSWSGVMGANGSGKTTLLRGVAGRLPIASGSCVINSKELGTERAARAALVGFAPPIERLPASLRVRELLALASGDVEAAGVRCEFLWRALELPSLLDRTIGECSSGMRQRASIALAFATPARIVILDEPFNWLDPVAAFDVRLALRAMVDEGVTLITALHDFATLCGSCDRGMKMAAGRATLHLTREDLRAGRSDARGFEDRMVAALRKPTRPGTIA